MANLAFIGLGVMGGAMAGHLVNRGGHDLKVCDAFAANVDKWVSTYKGQKAATPKEAAEGADFVLMCVGNDNDVRSVVYGDNGAFAGMKPGTILIDHTTDSAALARELDAAAKERNLRFIDAPLTGGQAGAVNGQLSIMVGGAQEDFDKAKPLFDDYGKTVGLMGPAGAGQLTKMVNQIAIGGLLQALAEAIHFAKKAGLDIEKVYQVISKGAAQSWYMDNRYKTMFDGEFDFGFKVDWQRKDLIIGLEEARNNGARLPVTALVDQFYGELQAMGKNNWDASSLIALLDRE